MKIGHGIDIHNLIENKEHEQVLAGLKFKLNYKIDAFSDGDIIFHSIANAILGALSLNDIGYYFSDKNLKNKNLNSYKIIKYCLFLLKKKKFKIGNLDINIICEKIIFKDIKKDIIINLVKIFKTKNISLKATRFEENNLKIQCHSTILIKSIL